MSEWAEAALGDLMDLDVNVVEVDDERTYEVVGVLNRGRGLLYRGMMAGSETAYKTLNRIGPNQVVYSRLKAFEGAITTAPSGLRDVYASQEFPTFTCGPLLLPGYFRLLTTTTALWNRLQNLSTGMGGRRERVKPSDFLTINIALPSLAEQRRIIDVIAAVDAQIDAVTEEAHRLAVAGVALRSTAFGMLEARTVPAGQKFNMLLGRQKSARQSVGEHVRPYLRAANIDIGVLALGDVQAMNFEPHEQEKYSLRNGDILLVEGGSLGQAARWNGEIDGFVGFDKHVIRLRQVDEVSTSEFALQWCHWAREVGAFEAQATGITIKALGFGRASAMPVPDLSIEEQKHFTAPLAAVEAARERVADELADLRRFRLVLLAALLCQEIAIPESYDDLLEEVS